MVVYGMLRCGKLPFRYIFPDIIPTEYNCKHKRFWTAGPVIRKVSP